MHACAALEVGTGVSGVQIDRADANRLAAIAPKIEICEQAGRPIDIVAPFGEGLLTLNEHSPPRIWNARAVNQFYETRK
jgi:hypothetical protein